MNKILNFIKRPDLVVKWALALAITIWVIATWGIIKPLLCALAFWAIYWTAIFLRYLCWAIIEKSWDKREWSQRYD